jgi:hypothetical protein
VKKDEMGRVHMGEEECIQGFGGNVRRKQTIKKTVL